MTPDQNTVVTLHLIQLTKHDNTTEHMIRTEDKFSYDVRNGSRDSMTAINQRNRIISFTNFNAQFFIH